MVDSDATQGTGTPKAPPSEPADSANGEVFLQWDNIEIKWVDSNFTRNALLELARSPDAEPELVVKLIQQWGFPTNPAPIKAKGWCDLQEWRELAASTRSILVLMAKTAAGELADFGILEELQEVDPESIVGWPTVLDSDLPEVIQILHNQATRTERWHRERRSGRGLELQQRLISSQLTEWSGLQIDLYSWDVNGRRSESRAFGLTEIVRAHIKNLFLAPDMDVFVCSVCDLPYLFTDTEGARRPRRGVRHFCTEACRKLGKRETNRLSWRKNGTRWRPQTHRRSSLEGINEPQS